MRSLIVSEFVSLDGVMEAPGGEQGYAHSGWVFNFMGPEQLRYKLDEVREAESLLLGRVTYQGFAAAWPTRDGEFADKMNTMPKHVVTTTLKHLDWKNSSIINHHVEAEVAKLKKGTGGPILVAGSRTLVRTLMEHSLVDEYRLMVFPVILGSGRRLFQESKDKITLQLSETQAFPTGVIIQTYRPAEQQA
jgi:dihydrofolate reductase